VKRVLVGAAAIASALTLIGVALVVTGSVSMSGPLPRVGAAASPTSAPATAAPSPPPTASPTPTPTPTPTPVPTPVLVPGPLTGLPVSPEVAARHPIAVMIDDLGPARPQSGFSDASVVWHAPAEGGIPRYMLMFAERIPGEVGPVRSARHYYIAWAAEWRATYVHGGGSPQALATLRRSGQGQLVYNADEFRWGGTYLWRSADRSSPHNVYTDGDNLRALAERVGAEDGAQQPVWAFGPEAPLRERPLGGRLAMAYPANEIEYAYDRVTNTYVRSVTGADPQEDGATGEVVAPKNVVVMLVRFGPLADAQPEKGRLEADVVGSGVAWIASNGRTIRGTWRKPAIDAPTRFFDAAGRPARLVAGQTFVQVLDTGSEVEVEDGTLTQPTGRP